LKKIDLEHDKLDIKLNISAKIKNGFKEIKDSKETILKSG